MTYYEVFVLAGSFLVIVAVLKFFSSVTSRQPVAFSLIVFLLGGGMLVYANTLVPQGLKLSDAPGALVKAIGMIFN